MIILRAERLVLLILFLTSSLYSYDGVFRSERLENYSYVLNHLMPSVLLLPINQNFYQKAINNRGANTFQLTEHSQDVYFYNWFMKSYEKALTMPSERPPRHLSEDVRPLSPSRGKGRRMRREGNLTSVDLFYVPCAASVKEMLGDWWHRLDDDLRRIIASQTIPGFVLDHTFVVASFPGQTRPVQIIHAALRNVRDMRFFRSDNDMTPNGRDVFIPYAVIRRKYQPNNSDVTDIASLGKRQHFLTAVCREAAGGGEILRQWRTTLYQLLMQSRQTDIISSSIVAKDLSPDKFNDALLTSDFCFVIPGDTPSTSKLYKALFSGCIPVIFVSFPTQLPFHSLVDWSLFSVIVYKDILRMPDSAARIDNLLSLLRRIREDEEVLRRWKQRVRRAAPYFDYSRWEYPSVYHLSLLELKGSIDKDKQFVSLV